MRYFTISSVWLVLILWLDYGNSFVKGEEANEVLAAALFQVGAKYFPFVDAALAVWTGFSQAAKSNSEPSPNQRLAQLTDKVNQISKDIKYYYNDLHGSVKELGVDTKLFGKLNDLYQSISVVENEYDHLASKLAIKPLPRKSIEESIKNIIDNDAMPLKLLQVVHDLTEWRDASTTVVQLITNPILKASQVCSRRASIQQIMYNHYQAVHGALMKGLWMLIFANKMDERVNELDKKSRIQVALLKHFDLMITITNAFKGNMVQATRDMWMCDTNAAKEGVTYERFGRAFQKYLFNLKNSQPIDLPSSDIRCPGRCEDIPETLYQHVYEGISASYSTKADLEPEDVIFANYSNGVERGSFLMHDDDRRNRCFDGTLKDCKTIKQWKLTVCKAPPNAIERYAYIKSRDNSWTYGSESSCHDQPQEIARPALFGGGPLVAEIPPCYYCMCTCDYAKEPPILSDSALTPLFDTDRYIDLHPVIADKGHVVTGVKIIKVPETHTFHLQIKQAMLLPGGRVSKSANDWKDIRKYYPRELVDQYDYYSGWKYQDGRDYHKIAYNNTVIYIDNESVERDDLVLTGVTFKVHKNDRKDKVYLGLDMRLSYFDFASGKIDDYEWYPVDPRQMKYRNRVKMEDLDIPTRFDGQNNVITEKLSYVELVNSGLEVDVGQNVLPFVDIQPVETNPPVPLAGVGLYHRGFKDSGGYLGLKATIINLTAYLPDTEVLKDKYQNLRHI